MSDMISHHSASLPSSEAGCPDAPSGQAARHVRARRPWRREAGGWLLLGAYVLAMGGLAACGDRQIIFCESDFDRTLQRCAVTAGAGGGGAGGSAGSMAGASGTGGTSSQGGTAGGGAGGTGGSAGGPSLVDASVPSDDAGDAGNAPDAAGTP